MKIGYFADGPWSHRALERICKEQIATVAFVCVRSDSNDRVLPVLAEKMGVPCLKHPRVNSGEFVELIRPFACDMFVSMSFNQIFKPSLMAEAPRGIINCHAGKLPFYRGRNILNWALINDEKEFGITLHHVDEGIDTGDIILQKIYPISDADNYASLLERAYEGCADVLVEGLRQIVQGSATRIPQTKIHSIGSYCGRRTVGDEVLSWDQTSREIFNFVRAICSPGPRATTSYFGGEVKINRVAMIPEAPSYKGIPGQIIGKTEHGLLVKTKDSFVLVHEFESATQPRVGERFV